MTPQELFEYMKERGITLKDPGNITDMDEYQNGQQPFEGFTVSCNKCNGKNIQLKVADYQQTDSGTDFPTEITLRCRECGFTFTK